MIMQPCTQEGKIADLQKSLNESDKRDVLQTQQILTMQKDITNIDVKVDKIDAKIDKLIESMENKFAAKWVEVTIRWVGGIILGAVILAIVGEVLVTK